MEGGQKDFIEEEVTFDQRFHKRGWKAIRERGKKTRKGVESLKPYSLDRNASNLALQE